MALTSNELSPADIAAVTGACSGNNCNGAWGAGGWDAWIILFLIFGMFGGWGGYGMGGNGMLNGALTRADLCQDMNFNQLENGVRGIQQGICDSTFALNNTVTNGINSVNNAICNLGYTMQGGFNAQNVAYLQGQNALQTQIAQCCCGNEKGQMQIQNAMERGFCQTNFNDQANTNAIIQNAHNDTDRVIARLDAMESARKDETIANLRTQLAQCGDQTTAQYIINQLTHVINPTPVPAYPAASPCGLGNWSPNVLANNCNCNRAACC